MRKLSLAISAIIATTLPQITTAQDAAQWTGPYVGLSFGYVDADERQDSTREIFGGDGGFGGFAGYDYAVTDTIVIGGELMLFDTEVSPDTADGGSGILENLSNAMVRVGYAKGNTLFYGGVGYMFADLESTFVLAGPSNGAGASVTLGIEAFVAEDITLRADITRSTLEDFELTADGFNVRTTSMRLGVAYRF